MFAKTIQKLRKFQKLDARSLFKEAFESDFIQQEVIRLITEEQLYESGEDGDGISLGGYSDFTKAYKIGTGQRYDHVTLNDTGDFYESVRLEVGFDVVKILGDYQKDDKDLRDVYGENILKLNDENFQYIKGLVLEFILNKIRITIL